MNVREMHERLIMYKLVRQVMEKRNKQMVKIYEYTTTPWLCNLCEKQISSPEKII